MTAPDWWTASLVKVIYGVRMVGTGDRWEHPGIRAAVDKLATEVAPDDLAIAFIRGAANPKVRTPAGVAKPGPHWTETGTTPKVRAKDCPDHPGQHGPTCRDCDRDAVPPPTDLKARIRAEQEAARAEREQDRQEHQQ